MRVASFTSFLLAAAACGVASAQAPKAPPAYTAVRWNEDYSYLANQPGSDPFDSVKYLSLGRPGWYASFGGQARYRYEWWNNELFGAVENDDGYFLQRYLLHADLHFGPVRVFAQGKSSLVDDGRETPPTVRATDADEIDVQQLFADLKINLAAKDSLTLRFGRQDLLYGAQRLISPLDWTNVRRTFEGGKASLVMGNQTLDAFLVRPVIVSAEELNDGNGDVTFGGVYDTIALPNVFKGAGTKLELYGLGLWQQLAVDSDIYTLGARFSSNPKPFDFDIEADYQFGNSGGGDVSAYALAAEGGYTLANMALTPRLYLGADYASGDDDATDGDVGTFNQLFPLGHAYFGYIDVIGRQNIIDVHPGAELTFMTEKKYVKKLSLRGDYHMFWRAEEDDAVYNAAGAVLRPAGGSDDLYIGSEIDLLLNWQINRHWAAYVGYSHFFAGDFIEDTGPSEDIDFVYAAVQFTF
jgi:hypothetical protein